MPPLPFSDQFLQERYLEQLMAGPFLSAEEQDVVRWGKNAKITIPKRFSQSGKHAQTYRAATAIECLVRHCLSIANHAQSCVSHPAVGQANLVSICTASIGSANDLCCCKACCKFSHLLMLQLSLCAVRSILLSALCAGKTSAASPLTSVHLQGAK